MSSNNVFQVTDDFNGLHPLINPSLLDENYAWVDERLREMYYGYALTDSNCDEYEKAGLLNENFAWVDTELEKMCEIKDIDCRPMPAPAPWANYRSGAKLDCLEEEDEEDEEDEDRLLEKKHTRYEFEISEYDEEIKKNIKVYDYDHDYDYDYSYYYDYDYSYEY